MASGAANRKRVLTGVQIALAVVVAVSAGWLGSKLLGYHQAQQVYRDIDAAYAAELDGDFEGEASPIDFAALQQQYPSVVAWLKVDDVDISYPVVQGADNDYYLHHDPANADNIAGSVFLDWRVKSLDTDLHSLIYAHNMLDSSMFSQLVSYIDEDFYQSHSGAFYLYTPNGSYRYKIFAVDVVDPTDDVYQAGFVNTQVFGAFAQQLKENSMYDTGVDVAGYDHVVTLSTCSDANRLVISAKRM